MSKTKHNPEVSHEEAQNAVAGEAPNAAGESIPSTVEDHIPSSDEPEEMRTLPVTGLKLIYG